MATQCINTETLIRCGINHQSIKASMRHSLSLRGEGPYRPEQATDEERAAAYEELQHEGLQGKS